MSGHSKWSQIKRQKGANDAKRGAVFTKLAREITIAARQGGGDPDANYRLRLAIDKARAENMPAENIKRAIDKATGGSAAEQFEEIVYEGYGPGGVAVMVETMTDNTNRTTPEIRHIFEKCGGNMGTPGSVSYMFDRKGLILLDAKKYPDEDAAMMAALDAGAEDFAKDGDAYAITCDPAAFIGVVDKLKAAGYETLEAAVKYLAKVWVDVDKPV